MRRLGDGGGGSGLEKAVEPGGGKCSSLAIGDMAENVALQFGAGGFVPECGDAAPDSTVIETVDHPVSYRFRPLPRHRAFTNRVKCDRSGKQPSSQGIRIFHESQKIACARVYSVINAVSWNSMAMRRVPAGDACPAPAGASWVWLFAAPFPGDVRVPGPTAVGAFGG